MMYSRSDVILNYNLQLLMSLSYSLFTNNTGENSIVSIGFQTFQMYGTNKFIGNIGSALRVSWNAILMYQR